MHKRPEQFKGRGSCMSRGRPGHREPAQQLDLFHASLDGNASGGPQRPDWSGAATIAYIDSRTVLTPAAGFIKSYKFTLNPYSGCSFGCDYCYARFFAPSPYDVAAWGQWVRVKQVAAKLIKKAMRARSETSCLSPGDAVYMSSVTDPYQPVEWKSGLTRAILQELAEIQPLLAIRTCRTISTRDIYLFGRFRHIRVNFTITTDSEAMRLR